MDRFQKDEVVKSKIERFAQELLSHEYELLKLFNPQTLETESQTKLETDLILKAKDEKVTIDPSRISEPGYL